MCGHCGPSQSPEPTAADRSGQALTKGGPEAGARKWEAATPSDVVSLQATGWLGAQSPGGSPVPAFPSWGSLVRNSRSQQVCPQISKKVVQAGTAPRLPAQRGAQGLRRRFTAGDSIFSRCGLSWDPTPLREPEAGSSSSAPNRTCPCRPHLGQGQGQGLGWGWRGGQVVVIRPVCRAGPGREGQGGLSVGMTLSRTWGTAPRAHLGCKFVLGTPLQGFLPARPTHWLNM